VTTIVHPPEARARGRKPRRGAVALTLARAELPRLLRHPGVLLGLASAILLVVTAGPWGGEPGDPVIEHLTWGLGMFPVPVAVAFALLGSRSKRNDTVEVEDATPGSERGRHAALVWLTVVPAFLALLVGLTAGALAELLDVGKDGMFIGPVAAGSLVVLGQTAVAAAAICCFALAAGTWLPHWTTAALMVVVVLQGADTPFHPGAWDTTHPVGSLLWHLAYGIGIALILAAAALLRHRRGMVVVLIAASGLVTSIVAGIGQ